MNQKKHRVLQTLKNTGGVWCLQKNRYAHKKCQKNDCKEQNFAFSVPQRSMQRHSFLATRARLTSFFRKTPQNYDNRFGLTRGKVSKSGRKTTILTKVVQMAQIITISNDRNCTLERPYRHSIAPTY